jgi:hypothetical protein
MTFAYFFTTNLLYYHDGRRWRTRDLDKLCESESRGGGGLHGYMSAHIKSGIAHQDRDQRLYGSGLVTMRSPHCNESGTAGPATTRLQSILDQDLVRK